MRAEKHEISEENIVVAKSMSAKSMRYHKEISYEKYAPQSMKSHKEISQQFPKSMKITLGNLIRKACSTKHEVA